MKFKIKKYELLAPAGDFECLTAAVNSGADAVYFGLDDFNMRARARNFDISDLPKIKKICESGDRKVKRYLTLNTIIYDSEIKKVEKIIKEAKPYINAVICWDFSVIKLCRRNKVPFHISTQASVSNSESAKFYKKLGAKRITLARELNLKQIKEISKVIPVETFVHGAMCVSVSGRCFISQFLFNESANRGRCIHPCRRLYSVKDNEGNELRLGNDYILSAKDLCTLPFVEKMKKAGVSTFKIEGRNKEPEYVETTVRVYRKAIDKKLNEKEIEEGLVELNKVYNKGFSSGFYLKMPNSDDFSKQEDSSASQSKRFIGKITHYFPQINVAALKLNSGEIKIGDDIMIIGKTTGVLRSKVESMEIDKNPVEEARKGQEVAIKLPLCRKGDEVYKVIQKTNSGE